MNKHRKEETILVVSEALATGTILYVYKTNLVSRITGSLGDKETEISEAAAELYIMTHYVIDERKPFDPHIGYMYGPTVKAFMESMTPEDRKRFFFAPDKKKLKMLIDMKKYHEDIRKGMPYFEEYAMEKAVKRKVENPKKSGRGSIGQSHKKALQKRNGEAVQKIRCLSE